MLPARLLLVDKHKPLIAAWREVFASYDAFEVHESDFFAHDADAMLSPANSFGIMDGGLDRAIRDTLGGGIQRTVHAAIVERHHGEIPVGAAEIVPTHHPRWPHLIVAPTMRVPESVMNTVHAYLAFRAALLAIVAHNRASLESGIRSVVVPGLGTGIGGMDASRCAVQMKLAYEHVAAPARIPSFASIHETDRMLRSS